MARKTKFVDIQDRISEAGYLFGTQSGVQRIQNEFSNVTGGYLASSRVVDLDWILASRINALQGLLQECQRQEDNFFRTFGLPPGQQGLYQLQDRVRRWNSSGASRLLDQDVALAIFEKMDGINVGKLEEAMNFAFSDDQGLLELVQTDEVQKKMKDRVIAILNEELSQLQNVKMASFATYSSGKERGLARYLTIVSTGDGGVQIQFDPAMPVRYKSRILKILKEKGVEVAGNKNTKASLPQKISAILSAYINDGEIRRYVDYELTSRSIIGDYGMYQYLPTIKGALGEIYWNAFFSYLKQQPGATTPTGLVKDNKKQINIDMLLHGYGFQIKNYTLKQGGVFEMSASGKQVGTFITGKAGIEQGLAEILLNFFAAWTYNRPVDDSEERYAETLPEYREVYSRFEELAPNAEGLFSAYIDKIIGLDREAGMFVDNRVAENLALNSQGLYLNAFFLINSKLVPSSLILRALIGALQKDYDCIRFNLTSYSLKDGADRWPKKFETVSERRMNLSNQVRIDYQVTLDLTKILSQVYSEIS